MDSRTLFRLAAPLALTVLLILAEAFGWPAGVKWGALVAMTLAWLAFSSWQATKRLSFSPSHCARAACGSIWAWIWIGVV